MPVDQEYLSDGVYAKFDGYQFELFTFDGVDVTNRIYLDPVVVNALFAYIERAKHVQIRIDPPFHVQQRTG